MEFNLNIFFDIRLYIFYLFTIWKAMAACSLGYLGWGKVKLQGVSKKGGFEKTDKLLAD